METVEDALKNSCNDALMQMSYAIGKTNFTTYQQIFGFGQKTNIDLPGETRTDSLIYTEDTMTAIDLATNSFGQNFNTSMIQLASAFCSIVNGGTLYQPRVVKKITDENGNTVETKSSTVLRETISEQTSKTLKEYMYNVVSSGTGATAKVDGYSMGGKTGTAQKAGRDGVNYLLSFIGYAPQDDPQLVIYCVVDEPNVAEQWHSTFAQNIVREILEEILPYMNIYRDEETTGLHAGWDIKGEETGDVAMTDVVNSEETAEEDVSQEDALTDIPDTTGELTVEPEE
jgi:stage V sporulation protein D (sporulation-specific penicillin-binding protein)